MARAPRPQRELPWEDSDDVPPDGSREAPRAAPPGSAVLTVGELTRRLAARARELGRLAVEGEVAALKRAGSGHVYFSLKDSEAVVSCVIWRSRRAQALRFEMEEGMRVVCHGQLDVYAPRGTYSLVVDRVERRGLGELLARLEELKARLRERGMFDRSRALPALPRCIGVVTSRDGAAFQDFLRTRTLRWPLYPLRLAHTAVQGPGAARSIAAALREIEASGVDAIALVRGGGSIEDLWAFNELPVAEAIWEMRVPVVTGIGHETDTTLADLVADHRAHTPTDAAQSLVPDRGALVARMERLEAYLAEAIERAIGRRAERLERAARARPLRSAAGLFADRAERVRGAQRRLREALRGALGRRAVALQSAAARLERCGPRVQLERAAARVTGVAARLGESLRPELAGRAGRLALAAKSLEATSPLAVLARGYSITRRRADGRAVRRAEDAPAGTEIETLLGAGRLVSRVERGDEDGGERGDA